MRSAVAMASRSLADASAGFPMGAAASHSSPPSASATRQVCPPRATPPGRGAISMRRMAATAAEAELLDRLVRPMPTDRLAGWLLPLAVTLFAGVIRFLHLSTPRALVFD